MSCHDLGGGVSGSGMFGLTGAAALDSVIGTGTAIATRERVMAVGAQRDTIGAGGRPAHPDR